MIALNCESAGESYGIKTAIFDMQIAAPNNSIPFLRLFIGLISG